MVGLARTEFKGPTTPRARMFWWGLLALGLFTAGTLIIVDATVAAAMSRWPATGRAAVLSLARLTWVPPAVAAVRAWARCRTEQAVERSERRRAEEERAQQDAAQRAAAADRAARIQRILDASEQMEVVLQPIVAIDRGTPVGFEALARFRTTPYRPPDEWFAEAWEVRLGLELELAAVRAALELLPLVPPECYLAVNVSAGTVSSGALTELLAGDVADRVVLELTEHEAVSDYSSLKHQLRLTRARLAVDDAGAGFASLAHVLHLAPEIIKLDRDLTSSIDDDLNRRALAASLVAFGEEVEAVIVAEGVETEAEAECLLDLGINHAQGYLFGHPAPYEDRRTSR